MGAYSALISRKNPGGVFHFLNSLSMLGNIFYVNSATGADTTANGGTPDAPFATIAYAITQCADANNDHIIVMPGHTESVIAASGITFANKSGITVVGQGNGSNRPLITMATATTATIAINAANITIRNIQIKTSIDELVKVFSVTAAGLTLDAVDFIDNGATAQAISFLLTTAAGTDLTIQNCKHFQSTAPAANGIWINLVGADRSVIRNNNIQITTTSNSASNTIASTTTAPVNILIENNVIVQLGGTATVPISLVASTSGLVRNNTVASAKTAIAGSIALASCYGANNYAAHVVNKNGLLEPVVDT